MNNPGFIFGVIVGAGGILVLFVLLRFLRPWLRARLSCGEVSLATIIGMCLRGNSPTFLIDAYLELLHSGRKTNIHVVESCYIANKKRIDDSRGCVYARLFLGTYAKYALIIAGIANTFFIGGRGLLLPSLYKKLFV